MWFLYVVIAVVVIISLVLLAKHYIFDSKKSTEQKRQIRSLREIKGDYGEWCVENILGQTVEGEKYVINGYITETNGKSTEIDHIVINTYGVFVIETKNRAGEIYGDDTADM